MKAWNAVRGSRCEAMPGLAGEMLRAAQAQNAVWWRALVTLLSLPPKPDGTAQFVTGLAKYLRTGSRRREVWVEPLDSACEY